MGDFSDETAAPWWRRPLPHPRGLISSVLGTMLYCSLSVATAMLQGYETSGAWYQKEKIDARRGGRGWVGVVGGEKKTIMHVNGSK